MKFDHLVYTAGGRTPAEALDNVMKKTQEHAKRGILTNEYQIISSQMICGWFGSLLFGEATWSYSITYQKEILE